MPNDQTLYYVYILKSEKDTNRHYTGYSTNPYKRLEAHNRGKSVHTSKYHPWTIETLIGFKNKAKAKQFENYLKSHAGRAFAVKHF